MSTTIQCVDRQSWLAERRNGIGGSDAPAAVGVCPWKSRFALWSEKTGLVEPADLSDNERVYWGSKLQAIIAEGYAERTGRQIVHETPYSLIRSDEYPWLYASLDDSQMSLGTLGVLEIKNVGLSQSREWEEEPPLQYQVQLQHQLAATGLDWGTLCCLIGGQRLVWFDFEANLKFRAAMLESEAELWGMVERQQPPEVDGSEATRKALAMLYRADNGGSVDLPAEFIAIDAELQLAKLKRKTIDDMIDDHENRLKAAIGDATLGVLPDGTAYSWKSQTRREPAREARESTYRVLRRKGVK